MADGTSSGEPSTWELGRSIGEVKAMLQNLVGTREYAEYQRHVTNLLGELAKDLATERVERENAVKAEREAREKAIGEIRAEQSTSRQTSKMAILTALGTLLGGVGVVIFTTLSHLGGH